MASRPPPRAGIVRLTALLLASLALAACGDDEGPTDAGDPREVVGEDSTGATPPDSGEKPTVEVPDGPPPEELVVDDLVEGEGDAAQPGQTLAVEYVGVLYENGEEFDSSYDRGEPFVFQLGANMVIPGWDEGLEGLREGGRRRLIIPPDLAYGRQGAPPDIGPNETLVFVIDLVDIR
ncbi:MAG TPA: FKBP-type peptidyl-prolyl cis-trans isomerase [Thermoleophilaceae bacterium]|nr:FKBP-type peptidyl-prolyl cis-trans isomerase [Thermoleophilaceae bacterium]